MSALNKHRDEVISVVFLLLNAGFAVYVSRLAGMHPKYVWEVAQAGPNAGPYPWDDILAAWLVFALATGGIYYILRKVKLRASMLIVYAIVLQIVISIGTPKGVGGVTIATGFFPFFVFVLAVPVRVWDLLASIRKPR